jgi:hypothetical protein
MLGIASIVRFLVVLVYGRYSWVLFGGYPQSEECDELGRGSADGEIECESLATR